jgi:hypothetical protein
MKGRGLPALVVPSGHSVASQHRKEEAPVSEYDGKQYVGIDLHRRRSVLVCPDREGNQLSITRITNDPITLAEQIGRAGPHPEVVLEATYGWYWPRLLLDLTGPRPFMDDSAVPLAVIR